MKKFDYKRIRRTRKIIILIFLISIILSSILIMDYSSQNFGLIRIIIGFISLIAILFVPGFFLIRLLKINTAFSIENLIYAFGLSISFLLANAIVFSLSFSTELEEYAIVIILILEIIFLGLFLSFSEVFTYPKNFQFNIEEKKGTEIQSLSKPERKFLLLFFIWNIIPFILPKKELSSQIFLLIIIITSIIILYIIYSEEKTQIFYLGVLLISALSFVYQTTLFHIIDIYSISSTIIPKWDIQLASSTNSSINNVFLIPFFSLIFHGSNVIEIFYPIFFFYCTNIIIFIDKKIF